MLKNIEPAFKFQFQDKKWVEKVFAGSAFTFLASFIFPIPLIMGYSLYITRNTIKGEKEIMPRWTNLGKMYIDGLKFFLAMTVYALPIYFSIIVLIVAIIIGATMESDIWLYISIAVGICSGGFVLIYSLLISLISPTLHIKYALGGSIGSLFKLNEIFSFSKNNIVNILIVIAIQTGAGIAISVAYSFFSFIPLFSLFVLPIIFAASFYLLTIQAYLYGQVYLQRAQ
ncbi:MAG: DUF4013 domain-containing protein [Parcubacteria group bacterium]|nr:DUF4013 domain-containing protein [Parcubacteria group bacterium]